MTESIPVGANSVVSISRTKFGSTGTTVVVGATVVVVVVVVVAAIVVTVGAIVVAGEHGSVTDGANTKPPSNTKGATTTDIRPAEARTQRVTITPAINMNKPAATTKVEPPVTGKRHTSTANITNRPKHVNDIIEATATDAYPHRTNLDDERFMLYRAVLVMPKFQPLTTCIPTSYQLRTVMPPTPSDRFYIRHRMTASGHRWTPCGHRRTPKGHRPHQKDTNFGGIGHTTTHHDESSSEHNTMSDDDSGIRRNATLEATLGIEPR